MNKLIFLDDEALLFSFSLFEMNDMIVIFVS